MSDHTSHKLWGGRFAVPTAAALDALNRSIGTDYRLWPFDINLSQAWAVALWGAGVLHLFGVGTTIGVLGGGRLADWRLMPSVIAIFRRHRRGSGPVLFRQPVPACGDRHGLRLGRSPLSLPARRSQIRVLNAASDAPNLASTLNQSAFNFGNAVGAWLGAGALQFGLAYRELTWLAAAVATVGPMVAVISYSFDRRPVGRRLAPANIS